MFGYDNLIHYSNTLGYMTHVHAPMPAVAAIVAIVAPLGLGITLVGGIFVRTTAILLAIYIVASGIIGHAFWSMSGMDRYLNEINFFKNISIVGGLILLVVTGAGRYSIDAMTRRGRAEPLQTRAGSASDL